MYIEAACVEAAEVSQRERVIYHKSDFFFFTFMIMSFMIKSNDETPSACC